MERHKCWSYPCYTNCWNLPCYDIFRNWLKEFTNQKCPSLTPYVPLVAGSLARALACTTCYPVELARTRMQAFQETNTGKKPPGVLKTLVGILSNVKGTNNLHSGLQSYRALWTGLGAQLARDVPYSAICWSTLEPTRRRLLCVVGEDHAIGVFGANFTAGFLAGSIAAATCPFDVSKTRRRIEFSSSGAVMNTDPNTRNTKQMGEKERGAIDAMTDL